MTTEQPAAAHPGSLRYVNGDATQPQGDGRKIIAHVCNDAGVWPWVGFAAHMAARWPQARNAYKMWYKVLGNRLALGTTQLVELENSDVLLANMIAQPGVRLLPIQPAPINYEALEQCLHTVANRAAYFGASVHMPRLNDWTRVEPIVQTALLAAGVDVIVYDGG